MFRTKTPKIRMSAAAQARWWSAGLGDSDSVKIVTGMLGSACEGFVVTPRFEKTDDVNNSGAVSPATRAMPSTAPVTRPPAAVGITIRSTTRQRFSPRARAASCSERGTRASTS